LRSPARVGDATAAWGKRYPAIGQMWRRAWKRVALFFAFAPSIRKMIYTTTRSAHSADRSANHQDPP
jgi:transposase-like protein